MIKRINEELSKLFDAREKKKMKNEKVFSNNQRKPSPFMAVM